MLRRNNNVLHNPAGFTLVELILVMTLMIVIVAFIAPSLARSFKMRGIDEEAVRLLAVTEYGRDEAVSQGVPVQVWIDPNTGNYGVEAAPGYPDSQIHVKQYTLPTNLKFDTQNTSGQTTQEGYLEVIGFDADGSPTASTGIDSVRIADENNNSAMLALMDDGWGYQVVKENANAAAR